LSDSVAVQLGVPQTLSASDSINNLADSALIVLDFSPLQVADVDWVMDGDTPAVDFGYTDGSAVVDWRDSSAAARHYGQNTTLRQPTYKTNLYNGHNAIRFGTNKCLVPDPTARDFGTANTLICVCTPSSAAEYILSGTGAEGRPAFLSKFNPGAGVANYEYWNKSSGSGERSTFDVSATGLHILTLARTDDTGNYIGYFDGTQVFSVAVDTARDWTTNSVALIGALTAGSSQYDGDIAYIIHCNRNLAGTSDLDDIHNYLLARYGI
jgi:hypothetical protein